MSILNKSGEDYFEDGVKLFSAKKPDKVKAVKAWKKAADLRHPQALYRLGMCYYLGEGVAVDKEQALKYFGEAAELGSRDAAGFLERVNPNIDEVLTEKPAEPKAEPAAEQAAEPSAEEAAGAEPLLDVREEDGKYVIRAGPATAYVSRGDCGFEIKTGSQFLRREVNIPDAVAEGRRNLEDLCFLKVVPGVNSMLESVKSIQVPYLKDAVSIIYGKAVQFAGGEKAPAKKTYREPITRREFLDTGMRVYMDGDMVKGLEYIRKAARYGLLDAMELLHAPDIDAEIRARVSIK